MRAITFFIAIFGFVFVGSVFSSTVYAASLYIDPATSVLNSGDSITMSVRLDVDEAKNECVNTVDAVITYPANIEPVDYSLGNSILRVWVEEPTINKDERTITFAGGIPNGYCGRVTGDPRLTNRLVEIIFRSPGFVIGADDVAENGVATINFADTTTVYLNDGLGTKAKLATYPATITLNDRPGSVMQNEWRQATLNDRIPPEEFSIEGPYLNPDGNYVIVYQTVDKQTGIDRYEVMEEPMDSFGSFNWGRADAPWIEPSHPNVYILQDQSLNSIIRVKAIDKSGNEYIATLIPQDSLRTVSQSQILTAVAVGCLLLVLSLLIGFGVVLYKRRKTARQEVATSLDESDAGDVDSNFDKD